MTRISLPAAAPLPEDLRQKYRAWKADAFDRSAAHHESLALDGQTPRNMVITCCDSRLHLTDMFAEEAGELFVQRNVGAFVPGRDVVQGGPTAAALEFAVTVLEVERLIVMGHSKCGGVKACHDMCAEHRDSESYIEDWVKLLQPAYARLPEGGSRAERLEAMEKESVLLSLENLISYPWIDERARAGQITLVGLWIDLAQGRLETWSPDTGSFQTV